MLRPLAGLESEDTRLAAIMPKAVSRALTTEYTKANQQYGDKK